MEVFAYGVIAFIFGCFMSNFVFRVNYPRIGTLEIDQSDPENIRFRFCFDKDYDLEKCEYVTFKVDPNADLSHK